MVRPCRAAAVIKEKRDNLGREQNLRPWREEKEKEEAMDVSEFAIS